MNIFAHNGVAHNSIIESILHIVTSDGGIIILSILTAALLVAAKHLRKNAAVKNQSFDI